jgi:two-component system sensor histidine kinase ChiS
VATKIDFSRLCKFTKSGSITVSAQINPPDISISVSDTGIGIPQNKIGDIFTSFEQLEASIAREHGGTGLGLSITKQLIELHGGEINVNTSVGKGSTFTFSLPISKEKPEPVVQSTELSKVRQIETETHGKFLKRASVVKEENLDSQKTFSILIVDDEQINQHVLKNYLSFGDYSVTQALDGEEALNIMKQGRKFDLILLDVMMPIISGYDVCQKIREKFLPNELPIIMITAKNRVSDLIEGFSSGANDYLAKPFSKDELLARIRTHLNLLKINMAYERFIPHEFIRFLERESIIDIQLGDYVQKEITILFCDIRSFTTLSEQMTPQETFNFLNSYLSRMGPCIREHNGFIDKYIGDSIMAIFPGSVENAIDAAFEMRIQLSKYNKHREKSGYSPISIGIGLHTGQVMLGTIGEAERMDGTVIADAVNLASRMEGLTKRYGASILVSEYTLSKMKHSNDYHSRFLGKVQVKGKNQAVSVFEMYDGDLEHIKMLKMKSLREFDQGLQSYFDKEFTKAAMSFKKVLKINPQDKTAKLYLERSAQFMVNGVSAAWQGIEVLENK